MGFLEVCEGPDGEGAGCGVVGVEPEDADDMEPKPLPPACLVVDDGAMSCKPHTSATLNMAAPT